jgi:hypothetical protein
MVGRATSRTPPTLSRVPPDEVHGALTLQDRAALLWGESRISLAQAAKLIPPTRQGKPVHASTLVRWILHGVRGVRLEAARLGGRWVTSHEALDRFSAALTARHNPPALQPNHAGPSSAALLGQECIERQLDDLGVCK